MAQLQHILDKYVRYRRLRQQFAKVSYHPVLKAGLITSIIPIMMMGVLIAYGRLSETEGIIAITGIFLSAILFTRPYLADLSALTHYVKALTTDRKIETPPLSFINNIEELSLNVRSLHERWGKRKIELESALAESSILFDILPDLILMLDENLNIARVNNSAQRVFGTNLLNQNIKEYISDKLILSNIRKVIIAGKGKDIEATLTTDGVRRDYRINIRKFPVYSLGGIAAILVLNDISETKRTKQMMKDFVSNASHEIRTPLTSVIGFIEMMQTVAKDDPKARQQFLDIMEQQAKQIAALINDLLCLSTAEMREHTPPNNLVNISDPIQSAIRNIKWQVSQKKMKIVSHVANKLPLIVGEGAELTQVVVNLLSNAIKYGDSKSTIEIKAGLLTHPGRKDRIFISIKNQGEILQEDEIDRLTQRFYRTDKVRSQNIAGSGLGLAIVKHILNRHKADMIISSKPEEGTIFTVRLPIATKQKILKIRAQEEAEQLKGEEG